MRKSIHRKTLFFIIYLLVVGGQSDFLLAQDYPIAAGFAHAHNDYEKGGRRDFEDAIKAGCNSIEIDVFPKNAKLKVAHVPLFLSCRGTLESRYIEPLYRKYKEDSRIFAQENTRLILMIDVKRNRTQAYQRLRELATQYKGIFAVWDTEGNLIQDGPIELLVSGAKPYNELLQDSIYYMRIDGDLGKIGDENYPSYVVPRVSARYGSILSWRGKGEMSEEEEQKVKQLVEKAHADGRQLRFWAMPNRLSVWKKMRALGVDWLNVDDLKKMQKVIKEGLLE